MRFFRVIPALVMLCAGCGDDDGPTTAPMDGGADASIEQDTGSPDPDAYRDAGSGACGSGAPDEPEVIVTRTGAVRGVVDPAGDVIAFRGIPFAAPPIGERRLRDPVEHDCWEGVLDAFDFGAICPQLDEDGNLSGDEDCLTLNVFAPFPLEGNRPVMFWVHGGGNNQGSSAVETTDGTALYDGTVLARRTGHVVVSTNYRLGPLGFLAHPSLAAGSEPPHAGNYGLLDQQAAMRWVHDHAALLGADASRLLLFGESAGGLDTCLQMVSPLAAGLFSRALVQSGGCAAASATAAEATAATLADALGCTGDDGAVAACLREAPVDAMLRALPVGMLGLMMPPFGPSIDGHVLPSAPIDALESGDYHHVPFVLGTNRDETSVFLPAAIATESLATTYMRSFLAQFPLLPSQVDAILAAYPFSDYASPRAAVVALSTDVRWSCPARTLLAAISAAQSEPAYRYYFTQTLATPRGPEIGAFHGLEIPYVFGHLAVGGYRPTAADEALSDVMSTAWGAFAETGDPNGAGRVEWPAYDAATDPYLHLGDPIEARMGVRSAQCDALAAALR